MSEARALAERNLLPKVGAVFARGEDGEVLFTFTSDPSSIVGPRPAKDSDRAAHPQAWLAFCAAEPAPSPKVESPPAGVAQGDVAAVVSLAYTLGKVEAERNTSEPGAEFVHTETGLRAPTYPALKAKIDNFNGADKAGGSRKVSRKAKA